MWSAQSERWQVRQDNVLFWGTQQNFVWYIEKLCWKVHYIVMLAPAATFTEATWTRKGMKEKQEVQGGVPVIMHHLAVLMLHHPQPLHHLAKDVQGRRWHHLHHLDARGTSCSLVWGICWRNWLRPLWRSAERISRRPKRGSNKSGPVSHHMSRTFGTGPKLTANQLWMLALTCR